MRQSIPLEQHGTVLPPVLTETWHSASEVEVIDAGHPLFGRRFRLVSVLGPAHPQARLRVAYGDGLFLTLPLEATDLAPRSASPMRHGLQAQR